MLVRQKLGMILENKVAQKLKLENNVSAKKWPGMVVQRTFIKEHSFVYRLYFIKSCPIFDELTFIDEILLIFSFEYVDSWPEIFLFRTHPL